MKIFLSNFILFSFVFKTIYTDELYDKSGDVTHLNKDNFDALVKKGDSIWIVKFYASWCGHCKSFAPEYLKAATAMKGNVRFGVVASEDKNAASLFSDYNVKGFPTVLVFSSDKNKPTKYNGARNAKAVVDSLLQTVKDEAYKKLNIESSSNTNEESTDVKKDGEVVILTDSNFEAQLKSFKTPTLIKFFAPWCGHCKAMYEDWKKAAKSLKGKFVIAEVDATVHSSLASKFGVRGYPTIKYFATHKGDYKGEDYNGGRTAKDILQWVQEKTGIAGEGMPEDIETIRKKMTLTHVANNKDFEAKCLQKKLCMVAILPDVDGEDVTQADQDQMKQTLTTVMKTSSGKDWGWVYFIGMEQEPFEEALNLDGLGYPSLTAVINNKKVFATMKTDFAEDKIKEFTGSLVYSKNVIVSSLPALQPLKSVDKRTEL